MATTIRVTVRDRVTAEKLTKKIGRPVVGPFGDVFASGTQVMLFERDDKNNARHLACKVRGKPGVLSAVLVT